MRFDNHDRVRIKNHPKVSREYWGRIGLVAQRENILVRILFNTEYQVVLADDYSSITLKGEYLERV